jgi:hypothetical protein
MNTIDIHSIHQIIVKDNTLPKEEENKWKELYQEIGENISEDVKMDLIETYMKQDDDKMAYDYYLISSIPILDELVISKKNVEKISFFKKHNESAKIKNHCFDLIEKYISIVTKYFPNRYDHYCSIHEKQAKKKKNLLQVQKSVCKLCGKTEESFNICENHIVCECGNVIEMTNDNLISYKDIERVNIGSKYSYDRKTHFRECIKRYQGKQNTTIPSTVFEEIITQLKNYKIISLESDIHDSNTFKDVEREHILTILKDLSYSKFYEDITYIYHKITNKTIPDISEYENLLLADFDKLLEAYDSSYKKDDRKNFINSQYVLYQLLQRHGYSCEKENFSFLKTNDRKSYHDEICSVLFCQLNWNFKALF